MDHAHALATAVSDTWFDYRSDWDRNENSYYCLYCDGESIEVHVSDNVPHSEIAKQFEHDPDCPVLIANIVLDK